MGRLSIEEKKEFGKLLNDLKTTANNLIDDKKNEMETNLLNKFNK